MANESRNRPYAPAASVIDTLQRLRKRNVPDTVDTPYLIAAGMSKEIATRVLTTFRFLGLLDDAGAPTDTLRALARSTDEDYRRLLDGVVTTAYSEVFTVVHPSDSNQEQIVNAFKRYEPGSQHYRMAVLFLALCKEAGVPVQDEPRRRETQPTKSRPATGKKPVVKQRQPAEAIDAVRADRAAAQASAVLWGYFKRLPAPRAVFTRGQRQAWLNGVSAAFDLEYEETDEPAESE